MTDPYPSTTRTSARSADASVGELVSQITTDVSVLMRQEFALAKAEMKVEATKAGKGAGLLGGAGFAGYMVALFASLTVMFLLDLAMPLWVAALIVTVVYGIAAAVLYSRGRAELKQVDPTPHQTVETLKEPLR